MLTILIVHLHFATRFPIDDLRLCGYEARQTYLDEEAGERVWQQFVGDFLPPKDHCGKRILGHQNEDPNHGDVPFTP